MPDYFLERYKQMTGDSEEALLDFSVRPVLRVNTLKTSPEELKERLAGRGVSLEAVPFLPDAYYYEADFSLGATEEYLLGLYYLQEAASQLPALALQHALSGLSGKAILDMAAAPGSKTTQLAALMENTGSIVALDADAIRLKALANNLERCGVSNAHVYHKDGRQAADLDMRFDGILLDAPCSGNMALEKGWTKKRQPHDPKSRSRIQARLLETALSALADDGVLIYSTCSLEPEEDEELLTRILPDGYRIVSAGLTIGDPALTAFGRKEYRADLKNARRLWPHRHGTQGFFLAAIRKE